MEKGLQKDNPLVYRRKVQHQGIQLGACEYPYTLPDISLPGQLQSRKELVLFILTYKLRLLTCQSGDVT